VYEMNGNSTVMMEQAMKRTLVVVILLICAARCFAQGTFTATLDGAHANPPNNNWFVGIANLQLQGYLLSYELQTTGPFVASVDFSRKWPGICIQGPTTVTVMPWFLAAFSTPSYDLIVYPPGTLPPSEPVYMDFFRGGATLSELQRSELLSGQGLLTIDFAEYGSIAGYVTLVPEPSEYGLTLSGAAAIGWYLRRSRRLCGASPRSAMEWTPWRPPRTS
jgi:hypothetical protein